MAFARFASLVVEAVVATNTAAEVMGMRSARGTCGPGWGSGCHAAVFLALPESGGITGQALNVDGGFVVS